MSWIWRCSPDGAYSQPTTSDVLRPLDIGIVTLIDSIAIKVYEKMLNLLQRLAIAKPDGLCTIKEQKDCLVKRYIRQKWGSPYPDKPCIRNNAGIFVCR